MTQPQFAAITVEQLALLHHTLGLDERRREPWRNHFMAGKGHHDQANLLSLVNAGMMTRQAAPEWLGGGDLFRVTPDGTEYAIASLPAPRKRSRYEQYLESECCESFAEWLGIEVPKREYNHYSWGACQGFMRLKSARATGEYCKTLKDAKISYKAALAKAKADAKAWERRAA